MPNSFIVILTFLSSFLLQDFCLILLLGRSMGISDILLLFHSMDRLMPAGPDTHKPAQSLWWGPFQDPENSGRSIDLTTLSDTAL